MTNITRIKENLSDLYPAMSSARANSNYKTLSTKVQIIQ